MHDSTPIHRLPTETIEEILDFLPQDPPFKPVWTFQAVCVRWREIIIGTSKLWTDIKIKNPCNLSILEGLKLQTLLAKRSRSQLLDVTIRLSLTGKHRNQANLDAIVDLLKETPTTRWKSLNIINMTGFEPGPFAEGLPELKIITVPLRCYMDSLTPLLTKINSSSFGLKEIHIDYNEWEEYNPYLRDVTSQLRVLSVFKLRSSIPPTVSKLNVFSKVEEDKFNLLINITHLRAAEIEWRGEEILELPNLQHLELLRVQKDLQGVVRCPNLLSLHTASGEKQVLHVLEAPSLRELTFTKHGWPPVEHEVALQLIPPGIISLSLLDYFKPGVISALMERLSAIRDLEILITAPDKVQEVFDTLLYKTKMGDQGEESVCSQLKRLTVKVEGKSEPWRGYDKNSLLNLCHKLLTERRPHGLRCIKIDWIDTDEMVVTTVLP